MNRLRHAVKPNMDINNITTDLAETVVTVNVETPLAISAVVDTVVGIAGLLVVENIIIRTATATIAVNVMVTTNKKVTVNVKKLAVETPLAISVVVDAVVAVAVVVAAVVAIAVFLAALTVVFSATKTI